MQPPLPEVMQGAAAAYGRGEWAQAEDVCRTVLRNQAGYFDALNLLGIITLNTRRAAEACEFLARAVAARPGDANAHANLGIALRNQNRLEEAVASYRRALTLNPRFTPVHYNCGNVLRQLQRYEEALVSYELALEIAPDYAEAHNNRGLTLRELGRPQDALLSHESAVRIRPDYAAAHNNRGVVLHELQRFADALDSYARALQLTPDSAEIHVNRGNAFKELRQLDAALLSYQRAVSIEPNAPNTLYHYANALSELRRFAEAEECYARVLEVAPDSEWLFGIWLYTKMQLCDWEDLESHLDELAARIRQGKPAAPPFAVVALLDSLPLQRQAAQIWVREKYSSDAAHAVHEVRNRHDRIRVGYFSADFRDHAVSRLVANLIESHDRSRFAVHGFSFGPDTQDAMRLRMEAAFESFSDVRDRSDREIAALARELEIDIAVDLGGFSDGARPGVFALRAAPLQVGYLGYLGTLGADFMDYLIADAAIVGQNEREHYAEKIIYLPSYQANDAHRPDPGRPASRAELGLPATGFVFCCFNATYKISPAIFNTWMRILKQVPGSVLFLLAESEIVRRNLRSEAQRRGVEPGRLVFGGKVPLAEYMGRYAAADLFLDTRPYNAGTTASDALWSGVPVLTLTGQSFAARVGTSLLTAVGLPELITSTPEQYESVAVELALSANRHASIREKLCTHRRSVPLFDTVRSARSIERAYSRIYARHLEGRAPEHLLADDRPQP